jgi:hypothetical protein
MKFRSTLALFVIVGVIAGYLYFFERKSKSTRERNEDATHVVPDFDRDKVDSISIRSPETKIELRKKPNGAWVMEEPARDRADGPAITELLTAVDTLQYESDVPLDSKTPKEQLKEFGVLDSNTKVKLAGGGKTIELILGKDTAVTGKSYLYSEGAKVVHVVDSAIKPQLQKRGDDFRDRKLADFGPAQVTKAEIKGPGRNIELTRKDNHWSITKPLHARGNDEKIRDLLASALNAHVEDFGSDLHLDSSGVSEPRGTVTFTQEGVERPVVLSIGQNPKEGKDSKKTWAKLSSREALVLVPNSIEDILKVEPNDLRDRNLLRVETDIVDRITIEPAAGGKVVLGRKGESWVGKVQGRDVAINDQIPPRILSDLQTTHVLEFVSEVGADLAKYGLDQPSLKVTFSSFASENTSETNAGDKPIVAVLFGKTKGQMVYAKVDDEPSIVAVGLSALDLLPTTAIELQDPQIFIDNPAEVTTFQVTSTVHPPLELERDKDKNWKVKTGETKLDQDSINGVINTFTRLRAVRWLGPVTAEHRLDKPGAVITATLTQGGKTVTRKLSIGANITDYWAAAVEGREGAFQLSRLDHDILTGPLDETPRKPAAGPQFTPGEDNGPGSMLGTLRGIFKPGAQGAPGTFVPSPPAATPGPGATPAPAATPTPLATPAPSAAPPK